MDEETEERVGFWTKLHFMWLEVTTLWLICRSIWDCPMGHPLHNHDILGCPSCSGEEVALDFFTKVAPKENRRVKTLH